MDTTVDIYLIGGTATFSRPSRCWPRHVVRLVDVDEPTIDVGQDRIEFMVQTGEHELSFCAWSAAQLHGAATRGAFGFRIEERRS